MFKLPLDFTSLVGRREDLLMGCVAENEVDSYILETASCSLFLEIYCIVYSKILKVLRRPAIEMSLYLGL